MSEPNQIDVVVGSRVRLRRMLIGMSQEKLADALNITFQQVQKYERGSNRISASKLAIIAATLGVPVGFFFETLQLSGEKPSADSDQAVVQEFLSSQVGLRIARAFLKIESTAVREKVAALVSTLAGTNGSVLAEVDDNK